MPLTKNEIKSIRSLSQKKFRDETGLFICEGEKLVADCLRQAKDIGFQILQFNAVVASNIHARHLYERLGFSPLGTIPGGFRMKDGHYEDICLYFISLI